MKIYLSYSHNDKELASKFKTYLSEKNFEVIWDEDLLNIGDDFNLKISKALFETDILIPIISEQYQTSKFTQSELQTALGFKSIDRKPIIFPYITYKSNIPDEVKNISCFIGTSNIENDLEKIYTELNKINGTLLARNRETLTITKMINENLDKYLNDTLRKLKINEIKNEILAYFCYILSIMFLLLIVSFISNVFVLNFSEENILQTILYSVKNIVGLSTLAALSRLAFILGKSFMVEAIRNGDRIHAISFGKFYIKAYGRVASRQEIREVLSNWNIDSGSSFHTQDSKEIDPNVYGAVELLKSYFNKE